MKLSAVFRAVLPVIACATAFCASEVWNTKDPVVWTTEDANAILNNSPWAKQIKVESAQSGGARRPGGMGGGGRRGGGMGGPIGYPGGGYPGGGYPGGGRGGSGGRTGGATGTTMSALVRWESAKVVQQALLKNNLAPRPDSTSADASAGSKQPAANPFENHYVVSVIGLRPPGRQSARSRNGDQSDGSSNRDSSQMRDDLMASTQLILKNKAPITPDDVKVNTGGGENEIQFFFPKTSPIAMDDKEVTFQTMVGRMKVENKFNLKKMTRNGKLELD
jgi:hypothetical protein